MTIQQGSEAEIAARYAGADMAELVIRSQLEAGVSPRQIEESAELALTTWFTHPTPASVAFCQGYAQVARAYANAAGEFDLSSDHEAGQ
jgi:hypothetical protein